ncbi:hypothetical protein QTP86_013164 [Hemibagrus guttatus]|nr:hypothetical protein QTP86_013164 [Hemibagrus guttatus]
MLGLHTFLNVMKIKEMVVDFRRTKTLMKPITIMGEEIGIFDNYKYLGVQLNNRLDWRTHTDAVCKKAMSRLYILRKLGSFNDCNTMLEIFYQSVLASAIYCVVVCISVNKLGWIYRWTQTVESVRDRGSLNKLLSIMDNPSHPLYNILEKGTMSRALEHKQAKSDQSEDGLLTYDLQKHMMVMMMVVMKMVVMMKMFSDGGVDNNDVADDDDDDDNV